MPVPVSRSPRAALLVLGLAVGCAGEPASEPVEPGVRLGTGEIEFEPLEDGDDLVVIFGPQGGYHVLGSFQGAGFEAGDPHDLSDPSNPIVRFELWDGARQLAPFASFQQGLDEEDGVMEMLGRFVLLAIDDDDEIVGGQARFTVVVEDASGTLWEDDKTVNLVAHRLND